MDLYEIRNMLSTGKSIFDLPLRVTYYARVSTEKDEQLNSFHNQISYFENKIKDVLYNMKFMIIYVKQYFNKKEMRTV